MSCFCGGWLVLWLTTEEVQKRLFTFSVDCIIIYLFIYFFAPTFCEDLPVAGFVPNFTPLPFFANVFRELYFV